jgi:threonine synthase
MKIEQFPEKIRDYFTPDPTGQIVYTCLACKAEAGIDKLLYTCPKCGGILMLVDKRFKRLKTFSGTRWQKVFDYRKMLNFRPLNGIFRFYEFIAPVIPLDKIIYLGEGHTPLVRANKYLRNLLGMDFYFKNEGMNPSGSFKDRGMACALSFINHYMHQEKIKNLLAICASTGDTSASAALYSGYLQDVLKMVVLLPQGKVTPQQLAQPLGSGAKLIEIPGVFDDCMKIVENLAENYQVALLNSKNSWRILGQESFAYELAQDFDYELGNKAIVLPIGNAGNVTAILNGLLKFQAVGVIKTLPKIIGVQSEHADPVFQYYREADETKRVFKPVAVQPSVAQAAMIGNPVSMPRVIALVKEYDKVAAKKRVFFIQVKEQEIMEAMLIANRNGNIVCTQGGESMAGLKEAIKQGLVSDKEIAILNSTAHMLKFMNFQEMYFQNQFTPDFKITPKPELQNRPLSLKPRSVKKFPEPGRPLQGEELRLFVQGSADEIAKTLNLQKR